MQENKKGDLRIRRTYKLLSEALTKLMYKRPFEKISVKDICDEAMVHRTTFYAHFTDKYDLLRYCMNELEMPFDISEIEENSFTGYKNYYMKVARAILQQVRANKEFYEICLQKNRDESFITKMQYALTDRIRETLEQSICKGIKLEIPVDFLASFYSGACINVIFWWLENDMPISIDRLLTYFDAMIREIKIEA